MAAQQLAAVAAAGVERRNAGAVPEMVGDP